MQSQHADHHAEECGGHVDNEHIPSEMTRGQLILSQGKDTVALREEARVCDGW